MTLRYSESRLRRLKTLEQAARARKLSPARRIALAEEMTAFAFKLRRAGLARLGYTPSEIRAVERARHR